MKKKLLLLVLCAVAAGTTLEARRGGHGRHHGRHGGWGRGWGRGWGPGFGIGFTVPIGGGRPRRPWTVKQFERVKGYLPSNANEFCSWTSKYFTSPRKARSVCNRYENYLNAPRYRRPAGYLSIGTGGGYGYGGYGYGGPWGYRRGWW